MAICDLTEQEKRCLRKLIAHVDNEALQQQAEALLLLSAGVPIARVAYRYHVSRQTIGKWAESARRLSQQPA